MRRYAVMAALMVLVGVVAGAVAVEADPGPKMPVNVQVVNDATSPVPVDGQVVVGNDATSPVPVTEGRTPFVEHMANSFLSGAGDTVRLPDGIVLTNIVFSSWANDVDTTYVRGCSFILYEQGVGNLIFADNITGVQSFDFGPGIPTSGRDFRMAVGTDPYPVPGSDVCTYTLTWTGYTP